MKIRIGVALAILLVCLSTPVLAQEAEEAPSPPPRPRELSLIGGMFAYGFILQIAALDIGASGRKYILK